jgi:hypothetical protein
MVHRINVAERKALRSYCRPAKMIREFIDHHQDEPGFSIAFDQSVYDTSEEFHGIPLPVILFKPYLDNHQPKYIFSMINNKLVCQKAEILDLSTISCGSQIFPDLVKVDTAYNYYYYDGWYYGVQPRDGFYRPGRINYVDLIKDRSLPEVQKQKP